MTSFVPFIAISLAVIVTPGPDTVVTIRNTLFGGRTSGVFTALGIASGQTIWAFATSVGIVALLIAAKPLFLALKYGGAVYVAVLGIRALQQAIRPSIPAPGGQGVPRSGTRLTPLSAFRQGVISDLGNPKMAVIAMTE